MRASAAEPPLFDFLRKALESSDAGATVLYRKLETALRVALTDGLLQAGASLPGERELADELDLSRATVRKAVESLVGEGFLVRRHGARTAVAARIEKPLASLNSFSEDMRSRGLEPGVVWLHRGTGEAIADRDHGAPPLAGRPGLPAPPHPNRRRQAYGGRAGHGAEPFPA